MLKHGHSRKSGKSPTYYCWARMIQRCTNAKHTRYSEYGARGIKICERWLIFENFLIDMGLRPEGKSLERMDNDGNYEPNNCRWATAIEQQNNRRSSVHLTIDGVTKTLAEWAATSRVPYKTFWYRIKHGWAPKDALV